MQRRDLLLGAGAIAALATAGQIWRSLKTDQSTEPTVKPVPHTAELSATLDALCDQVIPDTETPGAKAVGVSTWLLVAVQHQLMDMSTEKLQRFMQLLNTPTAFLERASDTQLVDLTQLDNDAFINHSTTEIAQHWRALKNLILMGYYSSEVGASQELRYKLVPGHFLPAVEIEDGKTRAWSSDWTAVDFG